jgi:hypothetical protein
LLALACQMACPYLWAWSCVTATACWCWSDWLCGLACPSCSLYGLACRFCWLCGWPSPSYWRCVRPCRTAWPCGSACVPVCACWWRCVCVMRCVSAWACGCGSDCATAVPRRRSRGSMVDSTRPPIARVPHPALPSLGQPRFRSRWPETHLNLQVSTFNIRTSVSDQALS